MIFGHSGARLTKGKFSKFLVKDHVVHLRRYKCKQLCSYTIVGAWLVVAMLGSNLSIIIM